MQEQFTQLIAWFDDVFVDQFSLWILLAFPLSALMVGLAQVAPRLEPQAGSWAPQMPEALEKLRITEDGWGMPLQLWVQAARQGLRVKEIGVPRLYLDPNRAFGGVMDDPDQRLAHYRGVIEAAIHQPLPAEAAPCCSEPLPRERTCW